jgi:hypothetical protein
MKNHDDDSIMIQLFIDDELKGQEREDLICHLKDFASCQEELEEAKVFSGSVRGARPKIEAPLALREKILSRMSAKLRTLLGETSSRPLGYGKASR